MRIRPMWRGSRTMPSSTRRESAKVPP
jgi:hypothetical protein